MVVESEDKTVLRMPAERYERKDICEKYSAAPERSGIILLTDADILKGTYRIGYQLICDGEGISAWTNQVLRADGKQISVEKQN